MSYCLSIVETRTIIISAAIFTAAKLDGVLPKVINDLAMSIITSPPFVGAAAGCIFVAGPISVTLVFLEMIKPSNRQNTYAISEHLLNCYVGAILGAVLFTSASLIGRVCNL